MIEVKSKVDTKAVKKIQVVYNNRYTYHTYLVGRGIVRDTKVAIFVQSCKIKNVLAGNGKVIEFDFVHKEVVINTYR